MPISLIVGLGNPTATYESTRHNIGFQAVEVLGEYYGNGAWKERQKFCASLCEVSIANRPTVLVKPLTYMNASGIALQKLCTYFQLNCAQDLLVLCDDIDISLGSTRLRLCGGPGTHNGLKSIVAFCGEDFTRLRIGIGQPPKGTDLASWILSRLSREETTALADVYPTLPPLVAQWIANPERLQNLSPDDKATDTDQTSNREDDQRRLQRKR